MPNPSSSTDSSFDIAALTHLHLTNPNQRDPRLLSNDSFDDQKYLDNDSFEPTGRLGSDDDSLYLMGGARSRQPLNPQQGKSRSGRAGQSSSDLSGASDVFRLTKTGHGGEDLQLSELEEKTMTMEKPFSFFARPDDKDRHRGVKGKGRQREVWQDEDHDEDNGAGHSDFEEGAEEEREQGFDGYDRLDEEQRRRLAAKAREEKLQNDVFILRKINASFAVFHEALKDVGSANERVAAQLEQTDALLNKYVSMLSKSEDVSRLVFDPDWWGAQDDVDTIEREEREAAEKARREEEERARQAQLELERRMREEQERREQEERERAERERKEKSGIGRGSTASSSGVRGVRGTRASARGGRGTAPPTRISPGSSSSTTRGRPASGITSTTYTSGTSSASGVKRPGSTSTAPSSRPSSVVARGSSTSRRS